MASVGAKESQTATQSVSITAVPTTSHETEATSYLVHKVSTIEQLDEYLGDQSKVILIEFFAEWCGPCKLIAQKLETWASMYDVTIIKVDIDELEDVAINYNVAGIPSFIFLKERQVLEQLEGSQEDKIIAALEKHCKSSGLDVTKRASKSETKKKGVSTMPAAKDLNASTEESEKAER